ncbi:Pheromone P-factor receptor [Lachnellula occidentalis]|uniref:Pheromone P-factor receptor n=1 Tax=Lachnellula occidentalis TaxID=215460 RepID=A0A8H8S338_9HELO|nr:Pheromone P-factor receptor [Lachnellula occidentalis]
MDFNPYIQNVTFLLADGVTPYSVSLATIDYNRSADFAMAINYGAQIGACLLMLFCVLLLTTDAKRWGLLFNLNLACLFTGFLSRLFLSLFYTSSYERIYTYYSPELPKVPQSDTAVSITSAVLPIFLTILVNLSLLLQAYTVLNTVHERIIRFVALFFSGLVFLHAMAWRFAEAVLNIQAIVKGSVFYGYEWMINGALAAETIAIWYFTIVFTTKLFMNLRTRRLLNQPSWSKMEVITVMGLGTMIIPSIFAIVEWTHPEKFQEAGSLTEILVIILLPLSSLWASVTPNSPTCSMRSPSDARSQTSVNMSRSFGEKFGSFSTGISSKFNFIGRRKSSIVPLNEANSFFEPISASVESIPPSLRHGTEADVERMGVRVERSYSPRAFGSSAPHQDLIYYADSYPAPHLSVSGCGTVSIMRGSKQTISWHHESIPDITSQRRRISSNLFSIISKFEELDAVSLPIKRKSLEPAPLQLARTWSRRQTGTKATQIDKASKIFSPKDNNNGIQEAAGSIHGVASGQGDSKRAQGSIDERSTARRRGKDNFRKASRDGSIRPHETFQDKGVVDTVGQGKGEGGSKRRRTIKDMIRLYDGSMNLSLSLSLSLFGILLTPSVVAVFTEPNTKAKPSLALPPLPTTPAGNQRKHTTCGYFDESSCSSEVVKTHSSTNSAHNTPSKRRDLVLGSSVTNPFLTPSSPRKAATSRTSSNDSHETENKIRNSQARSHLTALDDNNTNRRNIEVIDTTPTREPRGRLVTLGTSAVTGRSVDRITKTMSDKIEAIYRAKSLERQAESVQTAEYATTPRSLNIVGNARDDSNQGTESIEAGSISADRASKVTGMKKILEGRLQAKARAIPGSPAATSPSKTHAPNFSRKITANSSVVAPKAAPPPSPPLSFPFPSPPPPPMPEFESKQIPPISPKTILESAQTIQPRHPTFRQEAPVPPQPVPAEVRPRGRSKVVEDRIKLFEDIAEDLSPGKTQKKEGVSGRTIGNSIMNRRRMFFDLSEWKKPDAEEAKRNLSREDIQSIIDELQKESLDGAKDRWNAVAQKQTEKGTDKNDKSGGSSHYSSGSEVDMVVKEAQCGLIQPKPTRAAELKRMRLLCRGKGGVTARKEKGSPTEKL